MLQTEELIKDNTTTKCACGVLEAIDTVDIPKDEYAALIRCSTILEMILDQVEHAEYPSEINAVINSARKMLYSGIQYGKDDPDAE